MSYRIWINASRTVLMRLWDDDRVEIARRDNGWETWGPPEYLTEEVQAAPKQDGEATSQTEGTGSR